MCKVTILCATLRIPPIRSDPSKSRFSLAEETLDDLSINSGSFRHLLLRESHKTCLQSSILVGSVYCGLKIVHGSLNICVDCLDLCPYVSTVVERVWKCKRVEPKRRCGGGRYRFRGWKMGGRISGPIGGRNGGRIGGPISG